MTAAREVWPDVDVDDRRSGSASGVPVRCVDGADTEGRASVERPSEGHVEHGQGNEGQLPRDDRIEWHTEALNGQCHAFKASDLAEYKLVYTALCGSMTAPAFLIDKCVEPYCLGCKRLAHLLLAKLGEHIEDQTGGRME